MERGDLMPESGVKKTAYDLVKRYPGLRLLARRCLRVLRSAIYRLRTWRVAPDSKTVLFCSYHGKSCSCSPRAIYDYMLASPAYGEYRFFWAAAEPSGEAALAANPRTRVVPFGGRTFERAMAGAGCWVFNSTLPEHISPRRGQIYLQCWHGTPLKRLGCDIQEEGNAMNSLAEIRRKYRLEGEKVDFFLSPSPFASNCFRSAWQLGRRGRGGTVLELGYPRNDRLANATAEECQSMRRKLGIPQGKRVALYAPTFRDNQHISGTGYAYRPAVDFTALREKLGEDYVILFRAHYLVATACDFSAWDGFVLDVSGVEEINDLYLAADLLITDYSSTMFDYAVLRRPILFYMYDLEQYRDRLRGFYFDLNELPGPILTEEAQLAPAIRATEGFVWDERWEAFRQRFAPLDDGQAARRVTEAVIGKGKEK
ncbi:MAG: CDP-glycerol glycerophosphotransferase family protein [Clostridiales bacterium]|nr:CDP-glycerol glycerophosphotransferase family protein [Clostridiales bacterium]